MQTKKTSKNSTLVFFSDYRIRDAIIIKLIKNLFYNVSYQILTLLLPLITTPYLSRVLGAKGVGEYAFTYSNTNYFVLFGMLGITMYGSKCIAQQSDSKEELSKKFWEIYSIQFVFCVLAYVLFFVLLGGRSDLYFAQSFLILAALFDISWLYIGVENFKRVVIRNTVIKLVGIILIFLVVKTRDDLLIYTYILSISMLIGQISMWIGIKKFIVGINFNFSASFSHLKPTLLLFLPQIASSVYVYLDRTMLGLVNGDVDLGIYEQGQKILRIAIMIIGAISGVMMPKIANLISIKKTEEVKKLLETMAILIWVISFGMTFGVLGISEKFVPWFLGEEFSDVTKVFNYSAWIIIAIAGANLFAVQFLIPTNQQNKYTLSVFVSAIVNVIFNIILLPKYSFIGASISTVAAEFTGVFIQMYFVRNQLRLKEMLMKIPIIFCCSIGMYLCVIGIGRYLQPNIIGTMVQVGCGVIVYFLLLIITKVITKESLRGLLTN